MTRFEFQCWLCLFFHRLSFPLRWPRTMPTSPSYIHTHSTLWYINNLWPNKATVFTTKQKITLTMSVMSLLGRQCLEAAINKCCISLACKVFLALKWKPSNTIFLNWRILNLASFNLLTFIYYYQKFPNWKCRPICTQWTCTFLSGHVFLVNSHGLGSSDSITCPVNYTGPVDQPLALWLHHWSQYHPPEMSEIIKFLYIWPIF